MTMTQHTTLGSRLRAARSFAGLDQDAIAEAVGVHRTSVSKYENDRAELTAASLIKWAEATRISLDWLAWGAESDVRPKGFEPPTFWSVAVDDDREPVTCWWCQSTRHDTDDCPIAPDEFVQQLDLALAA